MADYEKLGLFYLGREYDPDKAALRDDLVLYDAKDLTTHAVVVGMTGSGKTGLCVSLLEEAAIDGIPALVIDPKGDIGNLLLNFPDLKAEDFKPWVDAADAARKNITVDQLAANTADTWRKGLAEWDEQPARIAKFRDAVDINIFTPGSDAGIPLSVLRSFAPPEGDAARDAGAVRDRISAVVGGLLGLVGIDADPLKSREYILLSSLLENAWRDGHALDLAGIITAVQKPGFDKVGVFDLETFYPAKERLQLAMSLNGLLASPGFAAWLQGEPLDIQRLLYTSEGKPRISIVSIAHLSDAERMFFVTLLLNEVVSWMRNQSGTSSLRAILYMDEIFGYFPPSAIPPSKPPMLLLLKQARAFGLGVVLATQNPVDLDYKGLANTGTWFIGRLQTERDKARVIDGLEGATGAGLDRGQIEKLISSLGNRTFLMRNVHEDQPVLMRSRWALSYLRGPLAQPEIQRLMAPRKRNYASATATPVAAPAAVATGTTADSSESARPLLATDTPEFFLRAASAGKGKLTYRPSALGTVKLHYVDARSGIDAWQTLSLLAPLSDDGKAALWDEAVEVKDLNASVDAAPATDASFASLPATAQRASTIAAWAKSLAASAYEQRGLELLACPALKTNSQPGESEGEFRARLALAAREQRDVEVTKLRQKYGPKLQTLQEQLRRAGEKVDREKSQASQQTLQTALNVGATVLGALFGRKALSSGNISKAATAARSAGRVMNERGDVARAEDSVEAVTQRVTTLNQECEAEIARVGAAYEPAALEVTKIKVTPRKGDIAVGNVGIAWIPWRIGADGMPARA